MNYGDVISDEVVQAGPKVTALVLNANSMETAGVAA
jgi:hypothetical protein